MHNPATAPHPVTAASPRRAFTLVELLVVIAIIGVLAGILIVAVFPLLRKGPDLQDVSDIQQLQAAVNNFKATYKSYPPSKIRLRANAADYVATDALDLESLGYINQFWPRMGNFTNYSWNGINTPPPGPKGGVILEGDQCLVFFLGGPGGTQGFSPDPTNPCGPVIPGVNQTRTSFFQFQPARLVDPVPCIATWPPGPVFIADQSNRSWCAPSGFPSYLNNWKDTARPYAYFSSGKGKNGYNSTYNQQGSFSHEIQALDYVAPYYDSVTKDLQGHLSINYLNPSSFQIISAGFDGYFTNPTPPNPPPGPPIVPATLPYPFSSPNLPPQRCHWNPAVIGLSADTSAYWKDNRSNFTPNQLQTP